jgi:two-component system cell cycle sensor histidine kinase/response regulator CckA
MFASSVATPEVSLPIRSELGVHSGSRKTVLLVEDDDSLSRLFALILERSNLRVVRAGDGVECLRLFEENRSDVAVVLMDCTLPDAHGGSLCHQLRQAVPNLPILLTSGRKQEALHGLLAADGPTGFLPKPFLPSDVIRKVRDLLEQVVRA